MFYFFFLLLKPNLSTLFSDFSYGAASNTGLKLAWLWYVLLFSSGSTLWQMPSKMGYGKAVWDTGKRCSFLFAHILTVFISPQPSISLFIVPT